MNYTYFVASIVAIGGFISGWDIGIISGGLKQIALEFQLTQLQEGSIVSILFAGAIVGCMLGGICCDWLGRKRSIHIQNVFYVCGGLSLFYASSLSHLLLGRFLMGIGTTMASTCEVPYLIECTDARKRGRIGSTYEIMVTAGVLFSYIANYSLYGRPDAWRTGFGLPALYALIQSVLLLLCPESPKWLLRQGRRAEAVAIYKRIFGEGFELDQLGEDAVSLRDLGDLSARRRLSSHPPSSSSLSSLSSPPPTPGSSPNKQPLDNGDDGKDDDERETAAERETPKQLYQLVLEYRLPFFVSVMLNFLSQFTGGTTVRVYAPTIFAIGGVHTKLALVFNIILGVIKLSVVLMSVSFVDGVGRKKVLVVGNACIGLGLVVLCIAFSPDNAAPPPSGVYLLGVSLVMGGYSIGWGPVLYLICSEMFPVSIRGRSLSFSLVAQSLCELFATLLFLPTVQAFGATSTFFCYLVLVVMTHACVEFLVVETSGKENAMILEDLRRRYRDISSMLRWSSVGRAYSSESLQAVSSAHANEESGEMVRRGVEVPPQLPSAHNTAVRVQPPDQITLSPVFHGDKAEIHQRTRL